ncbi:MAG: S1C family serine protease [Candidatus Dormibacteria bacterium]
MANSELAPKRCKIGDTKVDNNQDPQSASPEPDQAAAASGPSPSTSPPDSTLQWEGSGDAPPGGSGPPQVIDAGSAPKPQGPNWGRRVGAVVAAAAILVGVGFAGHAIGNSSNQPQADQAIPQPAATTPGVTSKAGTLNVAQVTGKVEPGVVDITAVDGDANATSAGTGMVLTSNGEVLTNNHVINGATSITAQVDGVGQKYPAKVVGYDATQDVALLQLQGASNLKTVTVGNSSSVVVGLPVVAIGNALDLPGKPTVTTGTITALNRSVTASDEGNTSSENLSGLFQSDASLCSGNSGGPLANSSGQVIGMNTAAETNSSDSCSTVGFSIPINSALSVASQIQKGNASSTVNIGLPAFLGVDVEDASSANGGGYGGYGYTPPVNSGALVVNVVPQTAAQSAGLVAGDVITKANGATITSESSLGHVIHGLKPGQTISISWVDANDNSHSSNVTLGTGPAG